MDGYGGMAALYFIVSIMIAATVDLTTRRTVCSAIAPMMAEPRISAPMTSQLIAGAVVTVFEDRGDWVHVRSTDDYDGWLHVGYLTATSGDEGLWRISLGVVVKGANGVERALPLGARLAPSDDVLHGDAVDADERNTRFGRRANAIAHSAATLFSGASYLWGGGTPWGCDCSGFVQSVYALHGVMLPRDAWQQAEVGTRVGDTPIEAQLAGDLLFFSDRDDRRVTHVGVALDEERMVHSSLRRGGIAIETWSSADDIAKRLHDQCVGVHRVV